MRCRRLMGTWVARQRSPHRGLAMKSWCKRTYRVGRQYSPLPRDGPGCARIGTLLSSPCRSHLSDRRVPQRVARYLPTSDVYEAVPTQGACTDCSASKNRRNVRTYEQVNRRSLPCLDGGLRPFEWCASSEGRRAVDACKSKRRAAALDFGLDNRPTGSPDCPTVRVHNCRVPMRGRSRSRDASLLRCIPTRRYAADLASYKDARWLTRLLSLRPITRK